MSEILRKYKEKNEYLLQLMAAYQELVCSMLAHLKAEVKDNEPLIKAIDTLANRTKAAKNIFQVQQINKDFIKLGRRVNDHLKETGALKTGGLFSGIGSLFGGGGDTKTGDTKTISMDEIAIPAARKPGKGIDLVDSLDETLAPYKALLEEFSKGTLLLADDREPFYNGLRSKRSAHFNNLLPKEVDAFRRSLYSFFINKSNEAGAVDHEREELKKIIGSLAKYIQSLSINSESFGSKLDIYSKQITAATELDEIQKIKRAILTETLEIQKVNTAVREKWTEVNSQLREADEKILKLEKELQMAREEKWLDPLTKTYNRGYFDKRLAETLKQFDRNGEPCCLVMVDLDSFKQFNDSYGQQAGDQVLRVVASLIKEVVRASDTVVRYSGEEFVLILYRSPLEKSFKVAESIREIILRHEFGIMDKTIHITASLGVTAFIEDDTPGAIVDRVDKAVGAAKQEGRNRTVMEGE